MRTIKKNTIPPYLAVIGAVCGIMVMITVIVTFVLAHQGPKVEFIPPEFESNALVGMPEVPEELDYRKLSQEGMTYAAYICGRVELEEGAAVVYFTNPQENDTWLKLRICDEQGNVLGETGLLKPGEYIREVPLNIEATAETPIKIHIMGYEPDTYFSTGSVKVNTKLY